jgi:glycosyltransferase involved in cell wall biosynthesis
VHKTCVIVPVYNHQAGIQVVCEKLASYNIPCILIDDGSDDHCRDVLLALANQFAWISLIRFDSNSGKGAAVCAGLVRAHERGYTHALQVDADGQHDLADLPRFLELSKRYPSAVVTGDRLAEGISATRHYGRKLTDTLVWLQTLSFRIKDSMCGYRLYPLPATCSLLAAHRVGQRMDFDTDILVRLYWRSVPIEQISTRVIYREAIPSHFRMVKDNLMLSAMHLRLLFGMVLRSPLLIWRKLTTS